MKINSTPTTKIVSNIDELKMLLAETRLCIEGMENYISHFEHYVERVQHNVKCLSEFQLKLELQTTSLKNDH